MADINLRFIVDEQGQVQKIEAIGGALGEVDKSAGQASNGGLASFTASSVQMAEGAIAGTAAALKMVDAVNEVGVSAIRAHDTLNNLSGGQADVYLQNLTTQTGGLVDQMTLAKDASFLLTRGLVDNEAELDKAAHLGAELGIAFGDTAAGGMEKMNNALEKVGSKRALYGLGIDVDATMNTFNKFRDSMGDEAAWKFAIFEQGSAKVAQLGNQFDKTGTALERLKVQASDFSASFSENVARGVEGIIDGTTALIGAFESGQAQVALGLSRSGSEYGITQFDTSLGQDQIRQQQEARMAGWTLSGQQQQNLNWQNAPDADAATKAAIDQQTQLSIYWESQRGKANQGIDTTNTSGSGQQYIPMSQDQLAQMSAAQARHSQSSGLLTSQDVADISQAKESLQSMALSQDQVRQNGEKAMAAFQGQAKAARDAAIESENLAAAAAKEAEARRSMSVNQVFGVKGNNLAGDVGSGMSGAIDAGRQHVIDADKGKSKAQQQADLAAYDREAKTAMDQYMISTGQATAASIKFGDIQSQVAGDLAKGKISVAQYAAEMLTLTKALEESRTSMTALNHIQQETDLQNAPAKQKLALIHSQRADRADENTEGGSNAGVKDTSNVKAAADAAKVLADNLATGNTNASNLGSSISKIPSGALQPLVASGTTLAGSTNDINTHFDAMPGKMTAIHTAASTAIPATVKQLDPLGNAVDDVTTKAHGASGAIGGIGKSLQGLVGTLTIAVSFSGSGTGGAAPVNTSGGARGQ